MPINNYSNTEIYFGNVVNNNVINLDITKQLHSINSYLNNFKITSKNKQKIYIYNNMFYEVKNKKHSCYRKDNLVNKEYKTNNKVIKIFSYNKKYLSTEIFPSIQEYFNEEEYEEIIYENYIHLRKYKDSTILYLSKIDKNIMNQITSMI